MDTDSAPITVLSPCEKRLTCIACQSKRHPDGLCIANTKDEQLTHLLSRGHDAALSRLLEEADYTEHTHRREVLRDIAEAARTARSVVETTAKSAPTKKSAAPTTSKSAPPRSPQGRRRVKTERTETISEKEHAEAERAKAERAWAEPR